MKKRTFLIPLFAILLAASPAVAEEETEFNIAHDKTGFYASPEVGIIKFADNCIIDLGNCEDTSPAFGISGGYLSDFFALEGGFLFANGFEDSRTDNIGTFSQETEFLIWQLGGRGYFSISEQFSFTAQLGLHRWNYETSYFDDVLEGFDLSDYSGTDSDNGTDLYFGVGGEFHINDNLSLRGEWTRYLFHFYDDSELDLFSGSVVWNF